MRSVPWLVLLACSLLSASARADPVEYLRDLLLDPKNPELMVLRYESGWGGLLISRDGGQTFSLLPSFAIRRATLGDDVPIHVDGEGKLLMALDDGLYTDDGQGCQLSPSGSALERSLIVDLVPHPRDPEVVFVLTIANSSAESHSGLWRRTATELTPLGKSDPPQPLRQRHPVQPTSLRVLARPASVGGLRFVEGALLADETDAGTRTKPVLRVSDDQGETWTTHPLPATGDEVGVPLILAIDGDEPFRALVALRRGLNRDTSEQANDAVDPILLTTDSGATFSTHNAAIRMADQVLVLPSGQVLIADRGAGGGLWSAADLAGPLTKIDESPVHCLGYRAETDTLFACRRFELGVYDLASRSFCAFFQTREVQGLVSCPSQPLADTTMVIDQVCEKWCGPLHYASSPVCDTLTSARAASCIAFARNYDSDAGHIEPPGAGAAERCAPPPLPDPADTGVVEDGGQQGKDDDDDAGDEEPGLSSSRADDGCGCRLARAHDSGGTLSISGVGALAAFWYRRRRWAQAHR